MGKTRSKYSQEFKENAVRLLNAGHKTAAELERDLGIGHGCIYRWRKEMEQAESDGLLAFPGNGNPRDQEIARLRKELAEVTEERDIMRKAVAFFSKTKR